MYFLIHHPAVTIIAWSKMNYDIFWWRIVFSFAFKKIKNYKVGSIHKHRCQKEGFVNQKITRWGKIIYDRTWPWCSFIHKLCPYLRGVLEILISLSRKSKQNLDKIKGEISQKDFNIIYAWMSPIQCVLLQ